ncbi:H(+)/Cl(-) exchange transporter ClcA [Pelotomaculum schinkii]|uniref:H(+)/Cl(-) exchange transporter ClcA n=1 Tax=Pelotomaculum schinkii TaxID=78350 RepID=A0A4Y7REB7_9FIRM|nr:ClC family H(+)/Cl(-) exchange transporter [Pelotomaculum schinkii]TEB07123.1 H(+)/Cl(-) exchange transporter ClcA [Pelotomaculum schinkii]
METKKSHIALIQWKSFRLKIFFEGILVGLFAGILVVAFRYLLEKAELLREHIYTVLEVNGSGVTFLWFIALIMVSVCLGFISHIVPMASGSGIPQVKGIILGHFKMGWLKIIIGKFLGGVLAIGSGMSLGREGPSIQLGAMAGQGVSRLLGRLRIEEKYLITSGASAGLAAAFNAPLAGVIFALEELHKNFSPAVLMSAMAASLTADLITQQVFGQKPVFNFHDLVVLPHNYYIYVVGLGVICGFLGFLFNRTLTKTMDSYNKITWLPKTFMSAPALILGGILGFFLPEVLGGGNKLIDSVGQASYGIAILLIFFTVKFIYTMISYGSGVPGGIFMPMLVIGALAGAIYGNMLIVYFHIDQHFFNNFVVLAMAAYFTAIVKAPVTGSILITEMTGSFDHLLALIIVSVTAYMVSDILKTAPIYETLLARSLVKKNHNIYSGWDNKTLIEVAVCLGSKLEGKRIMDIAWPPHCLLISIKRGEAEIIPRGNTKIIVGDYLFALANENESADIKEALSLMAGTAQTME